MCPFIFVFIYNNSNFSLVQYLILIHLMFRNTADKTVPQKPTVNIDSEIKRFGKQ